MSHAPLTARQQGVLEFVRAYRDHHGFAPTLREIGAAVGVSREYARVVLLQLKRKGAMRYEGGVRSAEPVDRSSTVDKDLTLAD